MQWVCLRRGAGPFVVYNPRSLSYEMQIKNDRLGSYVPFMA